jgi:hypothetical protein
MQILIPVMTKNSVAVTNRFLGHTIGAYLRALFFRGREVIANHSLKTLM